MYLSMTRYWFEFNGSFNDLPYGLVLGSGITAYN